MEHLASQELASVSRGHREERSGVHGTRRGLNDSAVEPWESGGFFLFTPKKTGVLSSRFCREKTKATTAALLLLAQLFAPRLYDATMPTLETLPRDVALRVFRFALFPGGPASLEVPELPRPEVHVAKRNAPQVPFDPVPAGVTAGLNALKAAARIATAAKALRDVVMDDALWKEPLAALGQAFQLGDDPLDPATWKSFSGSAQKKKKYRDPRHEKSFDNHPVFTQYRELLRYVKMVCEDFYESCHRNVRGLAREVGFGPMSQWFCEDPPDYLDHLERTDKPLPRDWYKEVFTDATIGRMVWNSFSGGLMRGLFGDDWDILIGGANAFEYETGNRERFMCDLVPEELVARGYLRENRDWLAKRDWLARIQTGSRE